MAVRSRIMLTGVALLATVGVLAACSGGTQSGAATAASTPSAAMSSAAMSSGMTGAAGTGSSAAPVTESNPVGDIPDTQAFVDYRTASGVYAVQVPEGWARTDSDTGTGGTATLFTDKYNSIRIDTASAANAPTVQTGQAELTSIQATAQGFTAGDVTTVQRQAGPALLITYQADSAPNSVTGKVVPQDVQRYEFWKNGTTVTLTLAAAVGSDNVDPWRTVTDSFRWTA